MKLYEFRCPECKATESYKTNAEHLCLHHKTPVKMKRLYSLGGVVLKGSGFYKTDNKKG